MAIKIKAANKWLLHKKLWVKAGAKIPAKKEAIKKWDSALLKKEKQFALNAKKRKH